MNRLILPRHVFSGWLARFRNERLIHLDVPIGRCQVDNGIELLATQGHPESRRHLRVTLSDTMEVPRTLAEHLEGILLIGSSAHRGEATGLVRSSPDHLEPLDELLIVGSGMHRIRLSDGEAGGPIVGDLREPADPKAAVRWSRTIGALGEDTWRRIVTLRFAMVGAGRAGTQMARLLARIGVRHIAIIDFDTVERWNLGESDDLLAESDVGENKAIASSRRLRQMYPGMRIDAIGESVTHVEALAAIKRSDFVICTCDHDSGRLAATAAAALFCRPILDVATGVPLQPELGMGATVRLVLPGRCLWCAGLDREASTVLRTSESETSFHRGRDWRQERGGSLSSLSQVSTGLALRLIEDLVAERIRDSLWMQLQYNEQGHAFISYPALPSIACPLCRLLAGRGDEGVPLVPEVIQSIR